MVINIELPFYCSRVDINFKIKIDFKFIHSSSDGIFFLPVVLQNFLGISIVFFDVKGKNSPLLFLLEIKGDLSIHIFSLYIHCHLIKSIFYLPCCPLHHIIYLPCYPKTRSSVTKTYTKNTSHLWTICFSLKGLHFFILNLEVSFCS